MSQAKWSIRPVLNSGSRNMKPLGMLLLPLDGMLVHRKVTTHVLWFPVPIYTSGWRETMWSKVPCLKKHDGKPGSNPTHSFTSTSEGFEARDSIKCLEEWDSNPQPTDSKSNTLLTQPRWLPQWQNGVYLSNNAEKRLGLSFIHETGTVEN